MHITKEKNRNFGLDLIRSLAIISVLFCHTIPIFSNLFTNEVSSNFIIWVTGYYGVEIFFILSGFLIGSVFIKTIANTSLFGKHRIKAILDFWIRRWFRTLPNFFLFFFIYWALVYLLHQKNIPTNYALFRVFTLTHGIGFSGTDFYGVSWSLAVEEWFYLLLPIFFSLVLFLFQQPNKAFLGSLFLIALIPFILKIKFSIEDPISQNAEKVFHYNTLYKLDSIFYGLLLAYLWQIEKIKNILCQYKKEFLVIGSGLIFLSLVIVSKFVLIPLHYSILAFAFQIICSIGLFMTFPFFINLRNNNAILNNVVTFISMRSYSLYLVHVAVIYVLRYFIELSGVNAVLLNNVIHFLAVWTISILLSHWVYQYYELPFLKIRDKISSKLSKQ